MECVIAFQILFDSRSIGFFFNLFIYFLFY